MSEQQILFGRDKQRGDGRSSGDCDCRSGIAGDRIRVRFWLFESDMNAESDTNEGI